MQLISFELYDEFVSRDDFMLKLSFFYAAQAVFQLCKVGGGIEGLQPAASIVYGIGSGVRSFFYEPARYICMSLCRHGFPSPNVLTVCLVGLSLQGSC
jgi:hypothetical protein